MIKTSLFADQEREAKLNKLGDALKVMEQQFGRPRQAAEERVEFGLNAHAHAA
ncbi:hypothetical protein [Massilia scottii]|uniref:hypothetical protein n=1 Tax=Massilia scottii TaxID=3057166 RepID=UPI0027965CC7|nr:hypothetical protein [Massilia sp. CCM 9029]MDQ1833387.1 hypothetical protein [Massilia sp. CCM 9029]